MIDGAVMLTSSGRYVTPLYPADWEPQIDEIAHHSSQINRFLGATRVPYSVAEHACRVSDLLPPELQLAGLLHDAPEAYLGDMPTYLKHHPFFGEAYRSAERALEAKIEEVFGVDLDHDLIHWADRRLLATEKRDLLPDTGEEWLILRGVKPLAERIVPWSPQQAWREFTSRYVNLNIAQAA